MQATLKALTHDLRSDSSLLSAPILLPQKKNT